MPDKIIAMHSITKGIRANTVNTTPIRNPRQTALSIAFIFFIIFTIIFLPFAERQVRNGVVFVSFPALVAGVGLEPTIY
jgi:hypothetical protein